MTGYDESFIPYDAQKVYADEIYTGENHIVDDELNGWLYSIKKKDAQLHPSSLYTNCY